MTGASTVFGCSFHPFLGDGHSRRQHEMLARHFGVAFVMPSVRRISDAVAGETTCTGSAALWRWRLARFILSQISITIPGSKRAQASVG